MFSTDFIFRQQENLLTTRNVRLDSGHYATKYYSCKMYRALTPNRIVNANYTQTILEKVVS